LPAKVGRELPNQMLASSRIGHRVSGLVCLPATGHGHRRNVHGFIYDVCADCDVRVRPQLHGWSDRVAYSDIPVAKIDNHTEAICICFRYVKTQMRENVVGDPIGRRCV
jgi:hypothetical protein